MGAIASHASRRFVASPRKEAATLLFALTLFLVSLVDDFFVRILARSRFHFASCCARESMIGSVAGACLSAELQNPESSQN
jgi:hypothetical protein